ncbi:HlyD family secretion protein [Flavobacterium sp. ov086]|jgi:membrane fusion protein (multidrug efflux system)|uniref:HlyD family secretion protein n=1 Tax=Flavobacterium sp. ov086 TaxID=1761785 RepID=UPI000B6CAE2B|nr:HlyD family secretion protein [Flavobacterium sp. ov086]SNR76752.1 membrane fusion protein, multidrug efflux system [Flavobacterium sp. ov086]
MKNHQRQAMNKTTIIFRLFMGLLAIVVLILTGVYFLNFDQGRSTDDAQVQQLLTPVNARVGGYIKRVYFKEFQWVNKGDTLVVIDDTDYRAQKELAQAALMDAEAGKKVTVSGVNTLANGVAVSAARTAEVKAKLWNAEKNFKRYATLLEKESVTQQQFDQVKSDYQALKAQVETLERARVGSTLTVQEGNGRVLVNQAALKRAQVQLNIASINLGYTVITAACDGYLGRKTITEGQLVQAGQQLNTIIDNENKWITANFKERQLSGIKVGQKVKISIDGIPGTIIWGRIGAFASATGAVYSMVPVDNATGNFVKIQQRIPVRIEIERNTSAGILSQLRAGMNAVVTVQ